MKLQTATRLGLYAVLELAREERGDDADYGDAKRDDAQDFGNRECPVENRQRFGNDLPVGEQSCARTSNSSLKGGPERR